MFTWRDEANDDVNVYMFNKLHTALYKYVLTVYWSHVTASLTETSGFLQSVSQQTPHTNSCSQAAALINPSHSDERMRSIQKCRGLAGCWSDLNSAAILKRAGTVTMSGFYIHGSVIFWECKGKLVSAVALTLNSWHCTAQWIIVLLLFKWKLSKPV